MTVIYCRKYKDYAVIASDALLTQSASTEAHEKIPLGFYLDEIFPPEIWHHPAKGLIQKIKIINDQVAIGFAGTVIFGSSFQRHLENEFANILSFNDFKTFIENAEEYQDKDFAIAGILLDEGKVNLFSYDFIEQCFEIKEECIIGSGEKMARRLQNLPSFSRSDITDELQIISQHLLGGLSMMSGKELFSNEAAIRTVGGAYIAYVTDGHKFYPISDVTNIFWVGEVDEKRQIIKQSEPWIMNTKKVDEDYLVRVLAHGESENRGNGRMHVEMKMDRPYLIEQPFPKRDIDIRKYMEAGKTNFTAQNYTFSYAITYKGIIYEGVSIFGNDAETPFVFKGDISDHWIEISPDIYLDAIDTAVEHINHFGTSNLVDWMN